MAEVKLFGPTPQVVDPLLKREQFAVSLRKNRKKLILLERRKRLPGSSHIGAASVDRTELSLDH